ncbi:hypothetical protein HYFRA_00004109 [Hymenoscyphus fraxineus]|uniref:Glucose-methanol-choline oxidoreductase N-terminal domain-containing protein n=1 Tax=Hymenoscyphus fraxineus TaxID=746836 RepID=A0A9N9KMP5_9HELO|nr:hypothetical protein HYFRA_00004109 [Hymenoscyphus fraxineus]
MAQFSKLSSVAVAIISAVVVSSAPTTFQGTVQRREESLLSSYDYVIIGGGASGLTVANRLTEDSATTVLVIEAGDFDANEDIVTVPGLAGGAVGTKYDWNMTYAANPAIGGREAAIALGKVVGGSTKLNRMVFDRGAKSDYDRWESLGNSGWGWDALLPYFKKNEIFTPPTPEIVNEWGVTVDDSAHGTEGPMHTSYSPFFWPTTKNVIEAFKELGVTTALDQANGGAIGGYFCPHNLDPATKTRHSAREAYFEPVKGRPNLHLLPKRHVTKVVTEKKDGKVIVTGVEYAESKDSTKSTIAVKKEAVLAAGAIFTPQILQLSGIGSSALLSTVGIEAVVDLPSVGQNLHDHVLLTTVNTITTSMLTSANMTSNTSFAAEAQALYDSKKPGPLSTPTGDYLAFLPLEQVTPAFTTIQTAAQGQDVTKFLPANTPPEVVAGYKAEHKVLTDFLSSPASAYVEFIWADGVLNLGLIQPFSRGFVAITSADPFVFPSADVGFLTNPADVSILVESVKYVRKFMGTKAITPLQPLEVVPGSNVTSDADIEAFVRGAVGTLFHPAGSCKMGKKEEGGCVDGELKVYGVEGLRVVDASMMPLVPGSHTMTTVYAVAEKAADMIKGGTQSSGADECDV